MYYAVDCMPHRLVVLSADLSRFCLLKHMDLIIVIVIKRLRFAKLQMTLYKF